MVLNGAIHIRNYSNGKSQKSFLRMEAEALSGNLVGTLPLSLTTWASSLEPPLKKGENCFLGLPLTSPKKWGCLFISKQPSTMSPGGQGGTEAGIMELLGGTDSKHSCSELGASFIPILLTVIQESGYLCLFHRRKLKHCEGLCLGWQSSWS